MIRIPGKPNPIFYLVGRKFTDRLAIQAALGTLEGKHLDGASPEIDDDTVRQIRSYIADLRQLAPDTLATLYEAEQIKDAEEQQLRAEEEERELFFHQPGVKADYSHWCRVYRTGRSTRRPPFPTENAKAG